VENKKRILKPEKGPPYSKEARKKNQQRIAEDKVRKRLGLKMAMLVAVFAATARQPSTRDPSYWKHPEPERSRLMKSIAVREYIPI
jgi:hypothetical protein